MSNHGNEDPLFMDAGPVIHTIVLIVPFPPGINELHAAEVAGVYAKACKTQ